MRISDWSSDVCFRSFAVVGAAQVGLRHDDNVANGDLAHDFGMGCQVPAAFDGVEHRDDTAQGDVVAQPGILEDRCDDGDRMSVVWGKSVSVRVDLGGRRILKKKKKKATRKKTT